MDADEEREETVLCLLLFGDQAELVAADSIASASTPIVTAPAYEGVSTLLGAHRGYRGMPNREERGL